MKLVIFLIVLCIACSQKKYECKNIRGGEKLYVLNCSGCHSGGKKNDRPHLSELAKLSKPDLQALIHLIQDDTLHSVYFQKASIDSEEKICNLIEFIRKSQFESLP